LLSVDQVRRQPTGRARAAVGYPANSAKAESRTTITGKAKVSPIHAQPTKPEFVHPTCW